MDNVRLKSRSNISILMQRYAILGLTLCMVSCTERNKQVLNSAEQISTPIILHKTLLSELQANNKPVQFLLVTMPKPEFKQLQGVISGFGKSIVPVPHFFIDKITAQPIPEDAQGKGLFTTYTTDDGLALDQINCSFKDRNGNLWFGTNGGGVSEYNGKTFTNYSKQQGLANNTIWCILEDRKGNFWFGTDGNGVSKFDGRVFTNYAAVDGLASDLVFSIYEDSKGNLWFGTFKGGISKYDGKKFTNYSTADGLSNNSVRDVIEDRHGDMWFATIGGGASKFDGKHFTSYNTSNGLSGDTVQSLHQDRKGNIWLGTFGGGLCKYDGKNFTAYTQAQGLANNIVWTVTEDTKGNIWAGTYGGGVSKLEGQRFTNYSTFQGLENNNVRCITEDNGGNIWVGTYGGGVSKFEGSSFSNFTKNQGLPNNVIFSITEDNSGDLWFGTSGAGVCIYDRKSVTLINTARGLSNGIIYSTAKDTKGNLWFGTFEGGVIKFDGKSFTNYTTDQGLANNTVFSIKEDKSGNLWFGTSGGGVSKFDGKSFTNFTKVQGLADNEVFCITEDGKGNLWFGTSGGGVSKFDGKGFTNFTIAQGLSDNMVWAITEDKANNFWVGTQQGLSVLPQKNVAILQGIKATDTTLQGTLFQTFTKTDGLPDNFVTQIVQGNDQKLYIGTNLGICEILPGAITDIPEKKWHTGRVFNSNTGYPVKDVNAGSGAMFRDSRGIIWIGTGSDKTGLVRFDPNAEISITKQSPVLVIESIKINQESLIWNDLDTTYSSLATKGNQTSPNIIEEINAFGRPLSSAERNTLVNKFGDIQFKGIGSWYAVPEKLVLPHNKNSISFDFNAIETGKNNLVKYQYFLEGYDKNWSPPGYKTTATFGNIYEGSYTFKLRAQSPDGVWSQPVNYAFKVLPPWYRTWWVYLLYAIVIVAVIYIIFRWNHQRIIQQKKVLEFKVAYATTQMREEKENAEAQKKIAEETLLELEATQAQLIQSEKMASLGELTAGIAHEIQNPLNFVNNFSEVNVELIEELNSERQKPKEKRNEELENELFNDIKDNELKINHHGKRAGDIVKGMLQHSRSSSSVKEPTDINKLADEYLRLAYHGLRAKDKSFNAIMKTDFDESIGNINIIPQDMGRVILNLITNAFYAVDERKKQQPEGYEPTVSVSTKKINGKVEVSVMDNGNGIPPKIVDKIFQPFFTTKPTGQGTGLGLSLSYDIVKAHGGELKVETKEGEGSEFVISLNG